ncbi:MAG: hypothetical protein PUG77_02425 [Helicobacter bilis]|uniref:hypothetical protein n=1 Tax=Helicobacter bilis TaxID=37372 RepID=UPI0026F3367E|nr:hypothetical protein [Helicobacter bilis]MDD7296132.1 hypothetical protein [Helicobacter bilis]
MTIHTNGYSLGVAYDKNRLNSPLSHNTYDVEKLQELGKDNILLNGNKTLEQAKKTSTKQN